MDQALTDWFDPRYWAEEKPDDVCYIHLSNRIDCYCILDRIDYDYFKRWLWCHSYSRLPKRPNCDRPDGIYARRSVKISGTLPNGRPRYGNLWLHKEILCRSVGPPFSSEYIGDHCNGNTLDNRRKNLRWATKLENAQNIQGSVIRKYFASRFPIYTP